MSVSRPLDPVRAATMAKSAMAPSGTGFLTPLRLPPDAVSLIACGDGLPLPSNSASVPIASPDAISGQPFLLLRVAAGEQDRFGREIDRGGKRHRRQRAAHFFGDHAEFEMAGAGAAECFRDRDAEKTHLGEALPQFAVIGLLAVEHRAHRLRRAFLGEEFSRLVAKLFLFVGEIEIHGAYLCCHSGARNARTRNLDVNYFRIPYRSEDGPSGMTVGYRYRGAMRMAPSRRMVSPFSIGFSTMWTARLPYSEASPSRAGCGTCAPRLLRASSFSPINSGVRNRPGAMVLTRILWLGEIARRRQREADHAALGGRIGDLADLAFIGRDARGVDDDAALFADRAPP